MTPIGPTDRGIRTRGAFIAASLGLVWLITAAGAHSTVEYLLPSLIYGSTVYLPLLVVVGVVVWALRGQPR